MADIESLKKFIAGIGNDRRPAGAFGMTSQKQMQIEALRRTFIAWHEDQKNEKLRGEFYGTLLGAHAIQVLSDAELAECENYLEEK